jgi:spermidine/putrescine-binding protein
MTKTPAFTLSRREALAAGGAALASPFIARRALAAGDFRILTWEGYAEPEWLKPFEDANGVTANITYVGSVDEMFAKMQGSKGADYDVVAFDTSAFKSYIESDLIQPIDPVKVPNIANLTPALTDVPQTIKDGVRYGYPFAWGSLPLIYLKSAFPDAPPPSWNVMWDPQYSQEMIALDDGHNTISLTAAVLGFPDPFNLTDDQFEQIKVKLIEQKALILTYYAGFDEGVKVFSENGVKLMFSQGEPQYVALKKLGVDVGLTIPKEGAIGWLDCWVISKGASNVDLAHTWINGCLDRSVGGLLSDRFNYGNSTDLAANEKAGLTYSDKLIWLQTPESFKKRIDIWNEVKAAS